MQTQIQIQGHRREFTNPTPYIAFLNSYTGDPGSTRDLPDLNGISALPDWFPVIEVMVMH